MIGLIVLPTCCPVLAYSVSLKQVIWSVCLHVCFNSTEVKYIHPIQLWVNSSCARAQELNIYTVFKEQYNKY